MKSERTEIGDRLQSAASRLAEFALEDGEMFVPYEVRMAAFEAKSAVDAWTRLRRRDGQDRERFRRDDELQKGE